MWYATLPCGTTKSVRAFDFTRYSPMSMTAADTSRHSSVCTRCGPSLFIFIPQLGPMTEPIFAARQPLREGRAREAGEKPLAVNAERFLREDPQQRPRVRPIHEARDRAGGEAAEPVGIAEDALAECDAALAHFRQLRAEHEPWK